MKDLVEMVHLVSYKLVAFFGALFGSVASTNDLTKIGLESAVGGICGVAAAVFTKWILEEIRDRIKKPKSNY